MSKAYVSQALRAEAETYFRVRCAYCRSPQALMNVTFEADHILPEKEGGLTVSANLAFACPLCNAYKGARTHGVDRRSGRSVPVSSPTAELEPALLVGGGHADRRGAHPERTRDRGRASAK